MDNKPIRVAQVVGKMCGGGVEAVIMNYYRNIDKSKVQFDFIVDEDSTLVPQEEIEQMGGRVFYVPPYQKLTKYISALKKIFKENNYKIVHSHMNTLSIFPLFVAKIASIPIRIAHNHSTAGKGEFKRNIIKYTLRAFAKIFPTHYFACSEYAGKWLFGKKFYNKGKVKVINNAIDAEKFHYSQETREQLRKEMGLEDKFVIIHIGRFMKQKNHHFVLEIFNEIQKKYPNSELLLVGTGPLFEEIEQKVQALKLQDKVSFLGNRNDVNELLCAADVFLLPSLYEGLPVVSMEAQASGIKMIASDRITKECWITEYIEFKNIEETPQMWADAVLKYKDGYYRRDTSEDIKRAGFEISTEVKKLEEYYCIMAGEKLEEVKEYSNINV